MAENISINFDGYVIRNEDVVKLLGLYIDDLLNFGAHVDDNICRKAGMKLNVLTRLPGVLNLKCKLLLFYSFILSQFEYCATIWHFSSRDKMRKIETLQKRALRQ